MRKFYSFISAMCFAALASGQITVTNPTNTTPPLSATYPTLQAAIAALNSCTSISGPVTIAVDSGNPQTAPAGGYVITATLAGASTTNTVTFEGNNNTITASSSHTTGAVNDAIFKIIGSDFITIQNFTMLENPANTNATPSTNNMTEFGVALFYATTTNGCQNITIRNNTIDLDRTYTNTFGIYSNSTHSSTSMTVTASATGPNGGNHNLVIKGNTITDVNQGIVIVGPTAAADQNTGIVIGGSASDANTITNYGTALQATNYANVSGTMNGILIRNSNGFIISHNTITSSNGGVTAGTLRAIFQPTASSVPTGTFTNTVSHNTISVTGGAAGVTIAGIIIESGNASTTSTLNLNNNDITNLNHTVNATTTVTALQTFSPHLHTNIKNNTFTNLTSNTSGSFIFINASFSAPSNGTKTVNDNSIVTGFNKTVAGGTVTLYNDNGLSTTGTTVQNNNNNFSNITVTGNTTITGWYNNDGTGATPQKTIKNNTFTNWTCGSGNVTVLQTNYGNTVSMTDNTISDITGQANITGISVGSIGTYNTALNLSNNTVKKLSSTGTGGAVTGISFAAPGAGAGLHSVSNNIIDTLSSSSTTATVAGISSSGSGVNISGHTIHHLSGVVTTSGAVNGIMITGGNNVNVFRNKIYDVRATGAFTTTTGVNGIVVSAGGGSSLPVSVYNNLIGDLKAPNASSPDAIRGISITSTTANTTYNIYYNTVYLDASSSSTTFGTSGIFHAANATSTTATLNLRNNIVVNNSTPAGTGIVTCFRRSGVALQNYGAASNNNDFFSTTGSVMHNGTTAYNITTFKALVAPRDASSFSENPDFQSTAGTSSDFLKYDVNNPKQIESGAVNISGITDDYSGTVRQGNPGYTGTGTAPDVGAWELEGILLDLSPPVITYTPLDSTLCTGDRTLSSVTITDASGVNTTSGTRPRLYFKKTTNANTFNDNTNNTDGWKYVEATGTGGSPFSFTTNYSLVFGGVAAGDTIQYFVVAQDLASTPNVGINNGTFASTPASVNLTAAAFPITGTINQYSIKTGGLSGTVTIGASGNYPTLTGTGGLFAAINGSGLTGNLTAEIIDATITEPGTVALNPITYGCSPPYTLLIKPANGVTATLSGSATDIIKLNGADYVTIDGSNNGTNSRDLTISNNNSTASGTTVIKIGSLGVGAGAVKVTVKNCIIQNGTNFNTTSASFNFGIFVGDASSTNNGADNDSLTIHNNVIRRTSIGLQAAGVATTGVLNALTITDNIFGDTASANYLGRQGIVIQHADSAIITGNTIRNVVMNNNTVSDANNATGISISTGVINSFITRNNITGIAYTGNQGYGGKGISINTGNASSNLTIANNFISDIRGDGWYNLTNDAIVGLRILGNTGGINLYYNSINLGSGNFAGHASGTRSAALYIASTATALNIRNNIFNTNLNNTITTLDSTYAIYSDAPATAFTAINYNDYNVSGPAGVLGYLGGARTTLAAWQSATGQDQNSLNVAPVFLSPSDLHLHPNANCGLSNTGTPISGITNDIDLDTRHASNPDMGADEFSIDIAPASSQIYHNPAGNNCASGTTAVRTPCATFNDNNWHDFLDSTGRIIASINPNGSNLGTVTVTVYQNNSYDSSNLTNFGYKYMGKIWNVSITGSITAGNEPHIRLYYINADEDSINSATGCATCNGTDLVVAQSTGITEDCDAANNSGHTLNLYWFKNPANYSAEQADIAAAVSGTSPNYFGSNLTPGQVGYTQTNQNGFNGKYIQINRLPSFSEFRITQRQSFPLPVRLLSFSGYRQGGVNKLQWTTSSEQDNRGFEVQRSLDGVSYSAIGFVNSRAVGGNSTTQLNYTYIDNNFTGDRQYYRLRQVDMNGRSKLSHVVLIRGERPSVLSIDGIFPNPATSVVNVLLAAPDRDMVTLMVIDATGRTVMQRVVNVESGNNTIPVDVSPIANGTYLLKVVCRSNCETTTARFVKQ